MSRTYGVRAYRFGRGDVGVYGYHPPGRRHLRVALTGFGADTSGEQLVTLCGELVTRCEGALMVELICLDTDFQVAQCVAGVLKHDCASVPFVMIDGC